MTDKLNVFYEKKPEPTKKTIALTMVLSFFIPVIIMALAFLKVRIWPNGKFTVLIYDLQAQFMPVYASMRYLGKSDHSLLFSFFGALGNNALLNYKTYLANPLLWMTALFPLEQLPNVLYFITLFNIGLCGLSFSFFLFFGRKENRSHRYPLFVLVLSCCYALMSFNVVYSMCINWLLEVALLPVMLLGVERLIEGKKGAIYILALTYALYNSDQLPYISGIFATLYLFYRFSDSKCDRIRVFIRFSLCSLISLGLSAPVFFPMVINFMNGRAHTLSRVAGKLLYYEPWKPLRQIFSCQYDDISSVGLPNIFCGTLTPILMIIGMIKSCKPKKTIIYASLVIVFFFASFSVVPINQFWHGFNEPNAFPVRYAYTYCAFILLLAYDSAGYLYSKIEAPSSIIKLTGGVFFGFFIIELYLNAAYMLVNNNLSLNYKNTIEYKSYVKHVEDALESIKDESFYRIGRDITYTYNDGMLFGYNGMGYFSSMYEKKSMHLLGDLGFFQNEHTLRETGGTPLTESILGVKYKIINSPEMYWQYDIVYKSNSFAVEKNPHALPIGFVLDRKVLDKERINRIGEDIMPGNAFSFQEGILNILSGNEREIYYPIQFNYSEENLDSGNRHIVLTFVPSDSRPVWIYSSKRMPQEGEDILEFLKKSYMELKVNGKPMYPFADNYATMCAYLGSFKENDIVTVDIITDMDFDNYWLAYFNENDCYEEIDGLAKYPLNITYHSNGKLLGSVYVPWEDSVLLLSLPYMKGYKISIDGIESEYGSFMDALLAIKLPKGNHEITISYFPPGLKEGLLVCAFSLILGIALFSFPVKSKEGMV